jgi:cellobiose-specific phosphotransferase system component IIA
MHAGNERAHLIEDLGALWIVNALKSEVLDGLLVSPLYTIFATHNHQQHQVTQRTREKDTTKAQAILTPTDLGRERGKSRTETIQRWSEEIYRAHAAANGFIDIRASGPQPRHVWSARWEARAVEVSWRQRDWAIHMTCVVVCGLSVEALVGV